MGGAGIDYAYANAYNGTMKTASYSDLRRNLSTMLDQVNADHEPVIITRDKGKLPPC